MGTGIAQLAAGAGHEVFLYDSNPQALDRAADKLEKTLDRLVEKGKFSATGKRTLLKRIHFSSEIAFHDEVGMVIEAIVEDLNIKKEVFELVEELVARDCILATNTSSLSVSAIASACRHPERVIGIHFFNPAPVMKLVEIIPALQTDLDIVQQATTLIQSWDKTTVQAKDTPGFIVNRVARPFYGEALRILDEGIADVATIDWAMKELGGFRMGPFELMDYIGNDVNYTVTETIFKAFYYDPRYKPSFTQKRLAQAGWLGRKTGRGYYDYREGAENPEPNTNTRRGRKIVERILMMLINEAADAVFWDIANQEDIELAMTKGVNYPKGLLHWADELGLEHCIGILDQLHEEYREDRYRPSPILRRMWSLNTNFFGHE